MCLTLDTYCGHYVRVKLNTVTIHLADSLYAIALKKAGEMGVERYLDHLVADCLLHDGSVKKFKDREMDVISHSPASKAPYFSTDEVFKTVLQIHAVFRYVRDDGMNFRKAVKVTAREFGVNESTVRDKCTRRISSDTNKINTEKFEELLKMPEKLVELLCQKYPDHRQTIKEKFNSSTP
jgi:hypothetical protein